MLEAGKLAILAKEKFAKVQELYKVSLIRFRRIRSSAGIYSCFRSQALDTQLPAGSFWKYCQLWGSTTSWVSFLASLTVYLETEALATKEQVSISNRSKYISKCPKVNILVEVSELIGLNSTTTVRLDIEEYLMGLCHLRLVSCL